MKILSVIMRALFLFSCSFGLFLSFSVSPSIGTYISYYTTQSNILCLIVMLVIFIWGFVPKNKNPRFLRVMKSLATVSIIVTFIIYHFILRPNIDPNMANVSHGWGNIFVHYITPIWFFADYLVFDVKGTSRRLDPLYYVLFPIGYFVYSNLNANFGELYLYGTTISQFPYPFLDYSVFGIYGVSAAILAIATLDLVIGFLFIALDKVMKKPEKRYHTHLYGAISKRPRFNFFGITNTNRDLADDLIDKIISDHEKDVIKAIDILDKDNQE